MKKIFIQDVLNKDEVIDAKYDFVDLTTPIKGLKEFTPREFLVRSDNIVTEPLPGVRLLIQYVNDNEFNTDILRLYPDLDSLQLIFKQDNIETRVRYNRSIFMEKSILTVDDGELLEVVKSNVDYANLVQRYEGLTETLKNEVKGFNEQYLKLVEENKKVSDTISNLENLSSILRNRCDISESNATTLEKKLEVLNADMASSKKELMNKNSQILALRSELASLKEDNQKKSNELASLKEDNQKKSNELASLKESMSKLMQDKAKLEQNYKNLLKK